MAVPVPRLAATILLLAPAQSQFKILMMKRHSKARFMANTYVFPGGGVDDGDFRSAPLSSEAPAVVASRVAALRELAEETGLAIRADGSAAPVSAVPSAESLAAAALVHPYAHWITPSIEKYRYDTWFFIHEAQAAAPSLPMTADPKEVADVRWVSPEEALRLHSDTGAAFQLPPPTYLIMHHLNMFATARDVIEDCRRRFPTASAVPVIEPVLERKEDEGSDPKTTTLHMLMPTRGVHLPVGVHAMPFRVQGADRALVHVGSPKAVAIQEAAEATLAKL